MDDFELITEDMNNVLSKKRKLLQNGSFLQCVKSPIHLDDIGGLKNLKSWLKTRKDSLTSEANESGIEPPMGREKPDRAYHRHRPRRAASRPRPTSDIGSAPHLSLGIISVKSSLLPLSSTSSRVWISELFAETDAGRLVLSTSTTNSRSSKPIDLYPQGMIMTFLNGIP